jgi:hypothetical protein
MPKALFKAGDAVTVWGLTLDEDLPVFYFKMEGTPVSEEERETVFEFYRSSAEVTPKYATLYDLSEGVPHMTSHVLPMISFLGSMRPLTAEKLQFTVVVCPDMICRGILLGLLKVAPTPAPFYIVPSIERAWEVLAARGGDGADDVTSI